MPGQKSVSICVSVVLLMSVVEANRQPERELRQLPATLPRHGPEEVSCDQRASCGVANANARLPFYTRNCFCDSLCRIYDDCCADFQPESTITGTGSSLPNLPRSVITCARVEEIDTAYEIYVVTKCPRSFSNAFIRDRCEDERISGEFYRLPVSGVTSGVLYRNAYCAMCANETSYLFWRMAHLCVRVGGRNGDAPDVRQMMRCPPELLPPEVGDGSATAERLRPRKCKSHVSQCEPRRQSKGGRSRRRCRGPTSYVYDGLQVYRNAACARCNRVTSADCYDERTPKIDVDELRRELFEPPLPSSALVLVIDLNAGTAEVHGSVPRRVPGIVDPSPPAAAVSLASCRPGEVYDPYDDSCRPVGCSWDGSAAFGSSSACPSTPTTHVETTKATTTTTTTATTTTKTTTTVATTTTSPSTTTASSPSTAQTTRRSKSNRRRTTTPWIMFDYEDLEDYYDYRDQYPHLFQTSSWQPRDAVLAFQTTSPYSAETPYPDRRRGNRVDASTTVAVGRVADRRRRTTTTAYSGSGVADGAMPCHLLPVDSADYTMLNNGSVSVRFPVNHRGLYAEHQYTYIADTLFVCTTLPTPTTDEGKQQGDRVASSSNASSLAASADLLVTMYRLDRIQNLASLVAVLVSMTALLVCLVVYLLFPALRRATSGRCLICLVVCLIVGQVLYLVTALHGFGAFVVVGDSSAQAEMCYWLAVCIHYILLAGAFWLNVIAMDAARTASADSQYDDVKSTSGECEVLFLAYSVYAWLAPAVIVGGALAAEEFQLSEPLLRPFYGAADVCWLAGRLGIPLLFALPVAALTVADLVLFAVAACRLPPGSGDIFVGSRWLVAGGLLAVLMALLWSAALLAAYTAIAELWYVFIGLHAALGLYVCLAYAAMPDVLILIRDSGSVGRRHVKAPNYDEDPWRNGGINGRTQSFPRSITYPVPEYDEVISQETSI